jgi:CheY-like chemotaxis protein
VGGWDKEHGGTMKILVVDDQQDCVEALFKVLSYKGHEVSKALGYQEALRKFGAGVFEMVLLDIDLPDGNGCELLKQMKHQQAVKSIAVTAHLMPAELDQIMAAGFDQCVVKPYTIAEIDTAMADAMDASQ